MRSGSIRIEALRFSLLIVLTIGLLAVAFHGNSHSPSHNAAGSSAATTTTLGQSSTTTSPSTSTTTVAPPSSTATSTPSGSAGASGGSGSGGSGSGGSGSGGSGGTGAGQPTLPVTGWGPAVKLGALALVLISAGALTMSAGGPRRRRN